MQRGYRRDKKQHAFHSESTSIKFHVVEGDELKKRPESGERCLILGVKWRRNAL